MQDNRIHPDAQARLDRIDAGLEITPHQKSMVEGMLRERQEAVFQEARGYVVEEEIAGQIVHTRGDGVPMIEDPALEGQPGFMGDMEQIREYARNQGPDVKPTSRAQRRKVKRFMKTRERKRGQRDRKAMGEIYRQIGTPGSDFHNEVQEMLELLRDHQTNVHTGPVEGCDICAKLYA